MPLMPNIKTSKKILPRWAEVTAVFGGAFDPPHLGHREAVRGLFQAPGVGRVLILPSANPPFKIANCSVQDRVRMTELAFSGSFPKEVEMDFREIKRAEANPEKPSYSFDSISELTQVLPQLAFVIGTDQLSQLQNWHRFPDLLDLCHWIVLERQPHGTDHSLKVLRPWIASGLVTNSKESPALASGAWICRGGKTCLITVPTQAPDISSTYIREQLARGETAENLPLYGPVASYLKERQLYGI